MEQAKNIVSKVMATLSKDKGLGKTDIQTTWKNACGSKAAKHSRAISFKEGELLINVDSPAWHFQLSQDRNKLLKKIQDQLPGMSKIRFKIGKVS